MNFSWRPWALRLWSGLGVLRSVSWPENTMGTLPGFSPLSPDFRKKGCSFYSSITSYRRERFAGGSHVSPSLYWWNYNPMQTHLSGQNVLQDVTWRSTSLVQRRKPFGNKGIMPEECPPNTIQTLPQVLLPTLSSQLPPAQLWAWAWPSSPLSKRTFPPIPPESLRRGAGRAVLQSCMSCGISQVTTCSSASSSNSSSDRQLPQETCRHLIIVLLFYATFQEIASHK